MPVWLTYLMDVAILCILAVIVMIIIFVKRNKYQKEAEGCIRAEIETPSGWNQYYTRRYDPDAESIEAGGVIYMLRPGKSRWGKHPLNPFFGLGFLQVPIRVEQYELNCPNPKFAPKILYPTNDEQIDYMYTSQHIQALANQWAASEAGTVVQELKDQQEVTTQAIMNQPNKNIVYLLLGGIVICVVVIMIICLQLGGLV